MRRYEIREADDGWEARVSCTPPEFTGQTRFDFMVLRQMSEADAHKATAFAMAHSGLGIGDLCRATAEHVNHPYAWPEAYAWSSSAASGAAREKGPQ